MILPSLQALAEYRARVVGTVLTNVEIAQFDIGRHQRRIAPERRAQMALGRSRVILLHRGLAEGEMGRCMPWRQRDGALHRRHALGYPTELQQAEAEQIEPRRIVRFFADGDAVSGQRCLALSRAMQCLGAGENRFPRPRPARSAARIECQCRLPRWRLALPAWSLGSVARRRLSPCDRSAKPAPVSRRGSSSGDSIGSGCRRGRLCRQCRLPGNRAGRPPAGRRGQSFHRPPLGRPLGCIRAGRHRRRGCHGRHHASPWGVRGHAFRRAFRGG